MPFTKTFTATTTEQDIVVQSETPKVTITEFAGNGGYPTVGFLIKVPSTANTAARKAAGGSYVFERGESHVFLPGQVLGRIALPAASADTLFQQEEA